MIATLLAPTASSAATSTTALLLCVLLPAIPIIIGLLIWRFFRSAVRSGVSQATPSAPAAPQLPGLTEIQVREIVRDELRRISAERAARAAASPRKA